MNIWKLYLAVGLLFLFTTVQAELIDRADGLVYDTVLDITWLQDANYALTSGYDVDGKMTWYEAVAWADQLVYEGFDDWRLASISISAGTPVGKLESLSSIVNCYTESEEACRDNEYGYMFVYNLGGWTGDDLTGNRFSISGVELHDIQYAYWSNTEFDDYFEAFVFFFGGGGIIFDGKTSRWAAWAVRDGDVSNLPIPSSGWTVSDFLTLCTPSTACTPTRAIEFDSLGNLYVEDLTDDGSGQIDILKLDAASGYSTSSVFTSYSTIYKGATGLDFDDLGSLYVSERSVEGDSGVIRKIDVPTMVYVGDVMAFTNHRPTGVDADTTGNVYYSARQESNGTWGKLFQIDSNLVRTELSASTVATGIALDAFGNIFITTPSRTDLPLQSNSIFMFRASDVGLLNPVLIATSTQTGGELTFDDGDLYMIAEDQVSIIKISPDDTDSDGIPDYMDNCTLVSNASQLDTDGDGYGNVCDADLNQDLHTDLSDFSLFRSVFATADPDADFNGDGTVDLTDFSLFRDMFGSAPGPSGLNP